MISFQALNLSTAAVGTWLTIPLILLVNSGGFFGKKWIEENIDEGQLDKYFFLLAGIMIVNQVSLPSSQVVVTVTVTVTVTPHKPLHSLLDHPLLVVTGLMYYANCMFCVSLDRSFFISSPATTSTRRNRNSPLDSKIKTELYRCN